MAIDDKIRSLNETQKTAMTHLTVIIGNSPWLLDPNHPNQTIEEAKDVREKYAHWRALLPKRIADEEMLAFYRETLGKPPVLRVQKDYKPKEMPGFQV